MALEAKIANDTNAKRNLVIQSMLATYMEIGLHGLIRTGCCKQDSCFFFCASFFEKAKPNLGCTDINNYLFNESLR